MDFTWLQNILSAAIAGILVWFLGRRKQSAEIDNVQVDTESKEIDNVLKLVNVWRTNCEELMKQVGVLQEEHRKLSVKFELLHVENKELKKELRKFRNG